MNTIFKKYAEKFTKFLFKLLSCCVLFLLIPRIFRRKRKEVLPGKRFAVKFCREKFWWVVKVERMSGNLLRDRSVRPSLLLTELSAQWPELEGSIIAQ